MNLKKNITMKHLTRSKTNKMLLGICGGLGEYIDVDPTIIRIFAIMIGIIFVPSVLVYLISGLVIPQE